NRRMAHPQRGFLLVMALVVLALLAVLLLSLSRKSGARAVEARDAAVELQRRWGEVSLAHALLPQAEALLSESNLDRADQGQPPTHQRRDVLVLGGIDFAFILADEQAKANINTLVTVHDDRADAAVRALLPSVVPGSRVELRPDARL